MKRKRLQFVLALLMTAAAGAWAQGTATTSATRTGSDNTYKVKMKEGTKDAEHWTISDGTTTKTGTEGLDAVAEGTTVTLKYTGRLKVKSVTATYDGPKTIDLSKLTTADLETDGNTFIVPDRATLTGTLDVATKPYKIVIPAGGSVKLAGVTIAGTNMNDDAHRHAGIECAGDATIILKDGTTNVVKGFYKEYPGISVTSGRTLTIQGETAGTGKLTASPFDGGGATANSQASGIGARCDISCGSIKILGGDITATGGQFSAGIGGSGDLAKIGLSCGDITISGGTVTATGGKFAAGIGSGYQGGCNAITISGGTVTATGGESAAGIGSGSTAVCYSITITADVKRVTAIMGSGADNSVGSGGGLCFGVTIGGTKYQDNADYYNGGEEYLTQSPFIYPAVDLSKLMDDYVAQDGDIFTGTMNGSTQPYKITIPDGATVTLAGANINGRYVEKNCAGINCAGDATIILKDGTNNEVTAFDGNYPGIHIAVGKTLTIKGESAGTGTLMSRSFVNGAGIGGGKNISCGNIKIESGIITAISKAYAAGIGSGQNSSCGDITISGGTIVAEYGDMSAGIGSGYYRSSCGDITISGGTVETTGDDLAASIGSGQGQSICGNITITSGVTKVTAKRGNDTPNCIGYGYNSSCGTVRIGGTLKADGTPNNDGTVYYDGSDYKNGGEKYLSQSPLIYPAPTVDLSTLTSADVDGNKYYVPAGATLTGTLNGSTQKYKITIPDGGTVTLANATITEGNDDKCKWAGITCEGDATIILKDGTDNWVKGFTNYYPGIYIAEGKTLTIKAGNAGTGTLEARGKGNGAGIGGGNEIACGNIIIESGEITVKGGENAAGIGSGKNSSCGDITISGGSIVVNGGGLGAGIGSGYRNASCGVITITGGTLEANAGANAAGIGSGGQSSNCGDITISGGTVTANGNDYGSAIGSGDDSSCSNITITKDVTLVTATNGEYSPYTIGFGYSCNACGTVTIGCELGSDGKPKSGTGTVYYDGSNYKNGGENYLKQSPLIYPPSNP